MRGFELTSLFSYLERQIYKGLMKRSDPSHVLKSEEMRWQCLKHVRWQRAALLCLLVPITTLKTPNQIHGDMLSKENEKHLHDTQTQHTCALSHSQKLGNSNQPTRMSYEEGKHLQTQENRKIWGFFQLIQAIFFNCSHKIPSLSFLSSC